MRRLGRPAVGIVPALLFFSYISQGPGNRNHTFQPLSICSGSARFSKYASRIPSPEISGGRGVAGAGGYGRTTFFTNFHIFPRTGQCAFPSGNSGQSAFPVRFFLLHRIGRPRLSALRGNARRSSKRTGTSPKTARRRIPLPTIRNHTIYSLSGTAVCGAMGIDERPAAKGLVKLARPCVALNCGSAVPFILDSSF